MVPDRANPLTPRERDCLVLVSQGRSSKEIAQLLDLSPYTVDEYIRSAVTKLGAPNRREAARMLASASVSPVPAAPEKLGDEPPALVDRSDSGDIGARTGRRESLAKWLPMLRFGRQTNDLGVGQRLMWIAVGAVAIVFMMAQLSQGMHVLQSMFRGR